MGHRRRAAPGVVIGQSLGRLGCFAAGCCYGKTAAVPWAVTFTDVYASRAVGTPLDTPLHPSQLYEALATFLIFAVLVWLAPRKRFHGQVVLAYVALYSVARFALEYFRGDASRGFIGPFSTSQAVAIVLVLLAVIFHFRAPPDPGPGARGGLRAARVEGPRRLVVEEAGAGLRLDSWLARSCPSCRGRVSRP